MTVIIAGTTQVFFVVPHVESRSVGSPRSRVGWAPLRLISRPLPGWLWERRRRLASILSSRFRCGTSLAARDPVVRDIPLRLLRICGLPIPSALGGEARRTTVWSSAPAWPGSVPVERASRERQPSPPEFREDADQPSTSQYRVLIGSILGHQTPTGSGPGRRRYVRGRARV